MRQTALISRINELPRLQKVLQELLDMVNQPEVDFRQLADKIAMEQVLSARLLRMANSAYFGGNKNIASVNDALLRVGSGPVRTLIVASVLSGAFPKVPGLDLGEYWADTFDTAILASKLGEHSGMDANEVFSTAILHNIGELMLHTLAPDEAMAVKQRAAQGEDRFTVQQSLLGCTTPELGATLAREWNFPPEMVTAIEHYPAPQKLGHAPRLAVALHFALDIQENWDDLQDEKSKALYLTEHQDARVMQVSAAFGEQIESLKGKGKELAVQMMG